MGTHSVEQTGSKHTFSLTMKYKVFVLCISMLLCRPRHQRSVDTRLQNLENDTKELKSDLGKLNYELKTGLELIKGTVIKNERILVKLRKDYVRNSYISETVRKGFKHELKELRDELKKLKTDFDDYTSGDFMVAKVNG